MLKNELKSTLFRLPLVRPTNPVEIKSNLETSVWAVGTVMGSVSWSRSSPWAQIQVGYPGLQVNLRRKHHWTRGCEKRRTTIVVDQACNAAGRLEHFQRLVRTLSAKIQFGPQNLSRFSMEVPKDEPPAVFLDRTSRATRGKRMTKLLDEEIEEDEMFWNQEALKEDEDDGNYEAEPEVADEFDSDFDEDEPDPDEGSENNDADERVRTRKRLIYPGKQSSKKKKKKKVISELESKDGNEKSSHPKQHQDAPEEAEIERTVRKSTRTSVVVRQAERDAIRAALQATMKPIKRKKEGEEKRMTQEEMLLEAAQTEIMNLRNLERVLAREEEVKKRAIVHKAVYTGPQVRYLSKDGRSYLEYSKGLSFQSEISTAPVPYPEKAVCAVTGLPAKYRDPKTGLPYATKEAFNIIRQRFLQESGRVRKEMDLGDLYGSLAGTGFLARGKRSVASNNIDASYSRYFARFRRIPALESESSD